MRFRATVELEGKTATGDAVRASYDALSYTHRKEWVRWIEEARKPETRDARVGKTVAALRAGKKPS